MHEPLLALWVDQYAEIGRQTKMLARMMETVNVVTTTRSHLVIFPNQSLVSKTRRYKVRMESLDKLRVNL